jgi:NDP-sugar pyrophosphorylase family protein
MQAVILAGGKGTRLRPYTTVIPKPLMPIGDVAILEVVLHQLRGAGFTRVVLAVSYLAELIEAFAGDGSRFGLEITYSRESKELSTAGPLGLIPDLEEDFLVMNGDLLTTLDYGALMQDHLARKAAATIAVHPRKVKIDLGVVEITPEKTLGSYTEKPEYAYTVSMGINVLTRRAVGMIAEDEVLGMPDLMLRLRDAGETVAIHDAPSRWLDIGRAEDYEKAVEEFEARREDFLPSGNASSEP